MTSRRFVACILSRSLSHTLSLTHTHSLSLLLSLSLVYSTRCLVVRSLHLVSRLRARRGHINMCQGLLPASHGQKLALALLSLPCLPNSGLGFRILLSAFGFMYIYTYIYIYIYIHLFIYLSIYLSIYRPRDSVPAAVPWCPAALI